MLLKVLSPSLFPVNELSNHDNSSSGCSSNRLHFYQLIQVCQNCQFVVRWSCMVDTRWNGLKRLLIVAQTGLCLEQMCNSTWGFTKQTDPWLMFCEACTNTNYQTTESQSYRRFQAHLSLPMYKMASIWRISCLARSIPSIFNSCSYLFACRPNRLRHRLLVMSICMITSVLIWYSNCQTLMLRMPE